ncbi:uncharacterized protein LOC143855868 [Tasmannia lanceolata]|uniref:uncharacterized protein LOC143855868 n=1 Tax=Tasmannia lanceolata TaxID=3420 RepID=UPI004063E26B
MNPPTVDNPSLGQPLSTGVPFTHTASSSSIPLSSSSGDTFLPMTTVKLDSSNYMHWKVAVEVYLIAKRKVYTIRRDPPAASDPTYEQWETDDAHIYSLLWQSMIPQISGTMMQLPTAKRIWDHTAIMFSGVGNLSRICATYSEWMHLRRDDTPLSTYYSQFVSHCQQLDVYMPLTTDLAVAARQRDQLRVVQFLETLGPEFMSFRQQLYGSGTMPSLEEVYQRAQQCLGGTSLTLVSFDGPATTTYAHGGGMRRPQQPSHAGRAAYLSTLDDSNPRASSSGSSPGVPSFTQADYDELQRLRLATRSPSAGFAQPGSTSASLLNSSSSWIIDSGASNHVTGTSSSLSSFSPLSSQSMTLADGGTTPISGIRSTSPYPGLTLSSDLATGRTIGRGREVDRLYRLDCVPTRTILHSSVDAYQWHCRLGHPCIERLRRTSIVSVPIQSFQVFGCVCFVHHLGLGFDKLDPRAERCIFLGYSRTQKGYHCYSPCLRRSFVSADVTLFESESYFVSSHETPSIVPDSALSLPLPALPTPLLSPHVLVPETTPVCDPSSSLQAPEATEAPPPAPMQTYPCRSRSTAHPRRPQSTAHPPPPAPSPLQPELPASTSQVSISDSTSDSPIASRTHSHNTAHPISSVVSYDSLTPIFQSFVFSLSSVSLPQSLPAALDHPGWRAAMDLEMEALQANQTWELVHLPPRARPVGCRWVYAVKHLPDGTIERLKAQLVAKGYTQTFGVDYLETFSPVAKIPSVRVLLSLAVTHDWPLHQLDVKNTFLHVDHSVFSSHSTAGCVLLIVYVDDVIITGSDSEGIHRLKIFLQKEFSTKDLGRLRYFLGIEVAHSTRGLSLSQRKYVLDLLKETGHLGVKPASAPMDPNGKLLPEEGDLLDDPGRYRWLVGKLIYFTVTRPDISFAVGTVIQQ